MNILGDVFDAGQPSVIHKFPEVNEEVRGLTLLNNELYVLRDRDVDQFDVYSSSDFTPLRRFSVSGLRGVDMQDMTSCTRRKCVYVSDDGNACIHRVGEDRAVSKWPVMSGSPWGLSVTCRWNLLVTCRDRLRDGGKLLELNGESGDGVREIELDPLIEMPWHCVQLNSGRYVVCHGVLPDNSRLSQVDEDGTVLRTNSGDGGLRRPYHVAVDNDQFVYVADAFHNRIVMYDTSLRYVRNVMEQTLNAPWILCFDDLTRRLYIGQNGGIVIVVQL